MDIAMHADEMLRIEKNLSCRRAAGRALKRNTED